MKKPNICRCAGALALVWLGACAELKDAGDAGARPAGVDAGPCAGTPTPIHQVQGPDAASPLAGETVTLRGVVVGDFQRRDQLGGFFLQAAEADGDTRTSEGIFVYAPGAVDLSPGNLVQVSGRVEEYSDLTELTGVEEIELCRPGEPPPPLSLSLAEVRDLEPYEGMLVTFPGELTIAGNQQLGDYGQLLLAAGGRPYHHTPGRGRRLLLDDGSRRKGPATPPYLDAAGTRRAGDVVSGLVGVVSEQGGSHVLHPTAPPRFTAINPRAAAPPVGGTVKVAGFNLLNFFTTLGERGAANARELERQRAKHVAAISALGADVVGLVELENNGEAAIRDLVGALNAAAGPGTWAYVPDPPGGLGDDAIRLGLIYRPAAARPIGPAVADRDPVFKRPPLAQVFEARGERFTVVVNHFKSKGCGNASGAEKGGGQGCWNPLRTRQARRLLDFVARLQTASGDDDVLVIGDLNAYGAEDPVRALTAGGLVDQLATHVTPAERYSFVYGGKAGCIDHALTTPSLAARVAGAAIWHINADEPAFLDYRVRQGGTEPEPPDHFEPDPYRSSDHDPVLIGLDF